MKSSVPDLVALLSRKSSVFAAFVVVHLLFLLLLVPESLAARRTETLVFTANGPSRDSPRAAGKVLT